MIVNHSKGEKVLYGINMLLLIMFALIAIVPFMTVIATSLSSKIAVDQNKVTLYPINFTLDTWKYILRRSDLWKSFFLTLATTAIGTALGLLITSLFAYPLSKRDFKLSRLLMAATVITMIFKAPVVPFFLTVRSMGLIDNPLVLIIPHVLNAYSVAIMRTFFRQIPIELEESAKIDGCGYFRLLFSIILPSSKAVLATIGLLYAVTIWNQFNTPLLFIQNIKLFPLQMKVRQFIVQGSEMPNVLQQIKVNYNDRTIRAATVVFTIIPIIAVYPYLQKYFVKGAMLGSVKG